MVLQIVGGVLVVAGIAWIFMVGRPWQGPIAMDAGAGGFVGDAIKAILDWAKDSLPKRMLPGEPSRVWCSQVGWVVAMVAGV